MGPISSLAEINARQHEFWSVESQKLAERISEPAICELALQMVRFDQERGLPFGQQKTLELAAMEADAAFKLVKTHLGKKGRRARPSDKLQILIIDILRLNPSFSNQQVLAALHKEQHQGIVDDIDEDELAFKDWRGRCKTVKLAALKHRFTRARKVLGIKR